MSHQIYQINIADHALRYRFREDASALYFRRFLHPVESGQFDIAVSDEDLDYIGKWLPNHSDVYLECKYLVYLTSLQLLQSDACIIHAAAFVWKGLAWLIAAPSGIGKTTQLAGWMRLLGEEVRIICGDMPVVTAQSDGTVRVWPSPWNGKEGWGGTVSAPLGGVIFLEQAEENSMELLAPGETVSRYFQQFACIPETKEQIWSLAALIDRFACAYPAWLLRNRGDRESTELSVQTLCAYLSKGSGIHETL